jgi:hypothetical protein
MYPSLTRDEQARIVNKVAEHVQWLRTAAALELVAI